MVSVIADTFFSLSNLHFLWVYKSLIWKSIYFNQNPLKHYPDTFVLKLLCSWFLSWCFEYSEKKICVLKVKWKNIYNENHLGIIYLDLQIDLIVFDFIVNY